MFRSAIMTAMAAIALLLLSAPADAQSPVVSASGTETFRADATALRMFLEVRATGKSLEKALENLKTGREAVLAKLDKLELDKKNISFSKPTTSVMMSTSPTPVSSPRGYLPPAPAYAPPSNPYGSSAPVTPPYASQRPATGTTPMIAPTVSKLFQATTTLTAEWPLEADEHEKLLTAASALQSKILAANLSGVGPATRPPVTESYPVRQSGYNANTPAPGYAPSASAWQPAAYPVGPAQSPQFFFVGRLSKEDGKELRKKAFARAKAEAAELAEAAGTELGPIVNLSGRLTALSGVPNQVPISCVYPPVPYSVTPTDGEQYEAVMATPDRLIFQAHVNAQFQLK